MVYLIKCAFSAAFIIGVFIPAAEADVQKPITLGLHPHVSVNTTLISSGFEGMLPVTDYVLNPWIPTRSYF